MKDHMPSDLIPIQNDMIISFVNYEVRVKLETKTAEDVRGQQDANAAYFEEVASNIRDLA